MLKKSLLLSWAMILGFWVPLAVAQGQQGGSGGDIGTSTSGLTAAGSDGSAAGFQENLTNDGGFSNVTAIEAPPARGGRVTPQIALAYNTNWGDGWLGYGWKLLGTSHIEMDFMRRTPDGPAAIDTNGEFTQTRYLFVASGSQESLVEVSSGVYRQARERGYMKFTRSGVDWEAVDALGTRFLYNVRQVDSRNQPVLWHLGEVIDTNNNRAVYQYRDITLIDRANDWPSAVSLKSVKWNFYANGTRAKNEIEVVYDHSGRADTIYAAAHGVVSPITARVSQIVVRSADTLGSMHQFRRYDLSYKYAYDNGRSLLQQIRVFGFDNSNNKSEALPPTTFSYAEGPVAFRTHESSALPLPTVTNPSRGLPDDLQDPGFSSGERDLRTGLRDLNGDGRVDYVLSDEQAGMLGGRGARQDIQFFSNIAGSPGAPSAFTDVQTFQTLRATDRVYVQPGLENMIDMNGDGRPDLVWARPYDALGPLSYGGTSWNVHYNNGTSFGTARSWNIQGVMAYLQGIGVQLPNGGELPLRWTRTDVGSDPRIRTTITVGLVCDITGDGVPDYVFAPTQERIPASGTVVLRHNRWLIFRGYISTANQVNPFDVTGGFTSQPSEWLASAPPQIVSANGEANRNWGYTQKWAFLADVNGDGLLDHCVDEWRSNVPSPGQINGLVYLNQGRGFESVPWVVPNTLAVGREYLFDHRDSGVDGGTNILQYRVYLDVNRDGLPDILRRTGIDPQNPGLYRSDARMLEVIYGRPCGFSAHRRVWFEELRTLIDSHAAAVPMYWRSGALQRGLVDVTGDGILDYVVPNTDGTWSYFEGICGGASDQKPTGWMTYMANGVGGWMGIGYSPTTQMAQTRLGGIRYVVTRLQRGEVHPPGWDIHHSPVGAPTEMAYANGQLHLNAATNRWEFRGFERVTRRRGNGPWSVTTYVVNDPTLVGSPAMVEKKDATGRLFETTTTTWAIREVGPVRIPYVFEQETKVEENTLERRRLSKTLEINDYGQVQLSVDYGDHAVGGDEVWTRVEYARPTTNPEVVGAPWRVTLYREVTSPAPPVTVTVTTPTVTSSTLTVPIVQPRQFTFIAAGNATWGTTTVNLGSVGLGSSGSTTVTLTTVNVSGTLQGGAPGVQQATLQILSRTIFHYDQPSGIATDDTERALHDLEVGRGNLKQISEEVYDLTNGALLETQVRQKFGYDADGNQTRAITMVDAVNGRLSRTRFDRTFNLFPEEIVAGEAAPRSTKASVALTSSTVFDYARHAATEAVDPNGHRSYVAYDGFGRQTRLEITRGGVRTLVEEGGVVYVPQWEGIETWSRKYHSSAQSVETRVRFDKLGRKWRTSTGLGSDVGGNWMVAEETEYDTLDRPMAVKGVGQHTSTNRLTQYPFYDALGRVHRVVTMPYVSSGNSPAPNLTSNVANSVFVTNTAYELTADGLVTKSYDANQNVNLPGAKYKTQVRDVVGRVRKVIDPAGSVVEYAYDPLGHVTKVRRFLNYGSVQNVAVDIETKYDSQGRKQWMRDPDRGEMTYAYDYEGNLVWVESRDIQNPNIRTRLMYQYDLAGRVVLKTGDKWQVVLWGGGIWVPDPSVWAVYVYDRAPGQEIKKKRKKVEEELKKGVVVLAPPTNPSPIVQRNLLGRLVSMTDRTGACYYSYDEQGNAVDFAKVTAPVAGVAAQTVTIQRAYSLQGRLATETVNGTSVEYEYNTAGWLRRVKARLAQDVILWEAQAYSEHGLPTQVSRGTQVRNGMFQETVSLYPVTQRLAGKQIGAQLNLSYQQYDAVGHLREVQDVRTGTLYAYSYDSSDQLATATARGGRGQSFDFSYEYDSLGNMRKEVDQLHRTEKAFGYTDSGLLPDAAISMWEGGREDRLEYELGSVVRVSSTIPEGKRKANSGEEPPRAVEGRRVSLGARTFTYDALGRMVLEERRDGASLEGTSYTYNGGSVRASQVATNSWPKRIYIDGSVDLEVDSAGKVVVNRHVHAGGARVTTLIHDQGVTRERHYGTDHLGSVRVTFDENGQVLQQTDYLPFGDVDLATSTSGDRRYGYTAQEHDQKSGFVFCQSRYYEPRFRRFFQVDTIAPEPGNPESFNRYSYVYNDPVNRIDPDGHFPWLLVAAIAFGMINGAIKAGEASDWDFWTTMGGMFLGGAVGAVSYGITAAADLLEVPIINTFTSVATETIAGGAIQGVAWAASGAVGNMGFTAIEWMGYGALSPNDRAAKTQGRSFLGELGASAAGGAVGGVIGGAVSGVGDWGGWSDGARYAWGVGAGSVSGALGAGVSNYALTGEWNWVAALDGGIRGAMSSAIQGAGKFIPGAADNLALAALIQGASRAASSMAVSLYTGYARDDLFKALKQPLPIRGPDVASKGALYAREHMVRSATIDFFEGAADAAAYGLENQ